MKFDFRASDLLDRMDWNDPDFPGTARMLESISHRIEIGMAGESVMSHVISVVGELAKGETEPVIKDCSYHKHSVHQCQKCQKIFSLTV